MKCQCCPHIETSQTNSRLIDWFLYEGNTGTSWVNQRRHSLSEGLQTRTLRVLSNMEGTVYENS